MAEIFGAVASGAGLVSLSMQLLESTQKLKGFFDSSRDAPDTVRDLCFDLETMSLSLRQIEHHRQSDVLGDELLGRCIVTCERAIANIKAEGMLRKARFAGRLYTAFRDPEVRRLLADMEHAKSSMSLAYMSYCQSWNVRRTMEHSDALTLQFERMKLLQDTVESGNVASIDQLAAFAPQQTASGGEVHAPRDRTVVSLHTSARRDRAYKCLVTLPRWFTTGVWEFTVQEVSQIWTVQVRPINVRPKHTYAFDFVRRGDTAAVRELLKKRELSVHDQTEDLFGSPSSNLLEIAAESGSLELCRFLLQTSSYFHCETIMHSALQNAQRFAYRALNQANNAFVDAAYSLFVGEYGLEYDFKDDEKRGLTSRFALMDRTEESIRIIMASQPVPLASLTPTQRFLEVIDSVGLPTDVFSELLYHGGSNTSRTKAKSDGKTALHWAAAHFGEWSQEWLQTTFTSPYFYASQQVENYRRLASVLIAEGADVHALWQPQPPRYSGNQTMQLLHYRVSRLDGLDPFVSLLAGIFGTPVSLSSLSNAVVAWGEMLVEGGYSLPEYIETENESLHSLRYTCFHAGRRHRVVKLVLFGEARLAIEVARSYSLSIWRAYRNSVPGAWPMSWPPSLPDTLIWYPSTTEEQEGFQWVETGEVNLESIPYRVQPTAVPDSAWALEASLYDARQQVFDLPKDDHGIVASILMRDRNAVQGKGHRLRRRALSAPPSVPFMTEAKLYHHDYDSRSHFSSGSFFHKCFFDARWTSRHRGGFERCARGHFDHFNLNAFKFGTDGWEIDLFNDEDKVPIARRFAERFCPHQLYLVQRTSERATQRARLAMGPHRKH